MGAVESCTKPTREPTSHDSSASTSLQLALVDGSSGKAESAGGPQANLIRAKDSDAGADGSQAPSQRQSSLARSGGTLALRADAAAQEAEDEDGFSFQELSRPLQVFREGLFVNADVVVRIGPVVGRVTDTSVALLLETETPGDVVVNVARVCDWTPSSEDARAWEVEPPLASQELDAVAFAAAGSVSLCHFMEAGRPYTFVVEGLEPATAYFVFLSNACRDDVERRVARFRTLPVRVDFLRLIAVSGHSPASRPLGSANPWQRLHDMTREGPEVQLVLHVGSSVDVGPAVSEAARELLDYASFREGVRKDLERRARAVLRAAFFDAWGRHEGLRRVLAEVGSHLPAFAPTLDTCSLLPRLADPGTSDEARTFLRIALEVSREYQRALWHASDSHGAPDARVDAESGESLPTAPFRSNEFWQESGPADGRTIEEWHLHRYGCVCIVMLDTQGSLLSYGSAGGQNPAEHSLLSSRQLDALTRALKDDLTQVIVLVSSVQFMLEPDAGTGTGTAGAGPRSEAGASSRPSSPLDWRSHPDELRRLLESLFEWKHEQFPSREVVLVSPGPGFGTTGDVCDHKLGLSFPAVFTGPMLGKVCASAGWALNGSIAGGRFSYSYRPPSNQWSFCAIDIEVSPAKPAVDLELIGVPVPPGTMWAEGP